MVDLLGGRPNETVDGHWRLFVEARPAGVVDHAEVGSCEQVGLVDRGTLLGSNIAFTFTTPAPEQIVGA